MTTVGEWKEDFKSFINELQMPRDDYKGIMSYIDEGAELLKEQEPRVLAQDDIEHAEVVWFEARRSLYIRPMLTRGKTFGEKSVPWSQYGHDWRCWSARPTESQRKAVKWDESQ